MEHRLGHVFLDHPVRDPQLPGDLAVAQAVELGEQEGLPGPGVEPIEQGIEMGRPSLITLSLAIERGRLDTVRIGGHAVRVSEGTIEV